MIPSSICAGRRLGWISCSVRLPMHNPIEPPWYVTRMPGGVTGKAREGLPMSINYRSALTKPSADSSAAEPDQQ